MFEFDRPASGERALIVHVEFKPQRKITPGHLHGTPPLAEFEELVRSAGAAIVGSITATRDRPDAAAFVGSGKVQEIAAAVLAHGAEVVLFNHALSPGQERNLEKALQCRVLDRAGVILDIFAQRARSFEGKLQVELAQLQHLSTRLVRGWTHLERQKGGIGLRGPGEMQLEIDRRLIGKRIRQIHERLEKVRRQRASQRRARSRAAVPAISLVGYTNAGKSTLFNALTGAQTFVADQLFATLDATRRRLEISGLGTVVFSDTVGFIRGLPHELVAAFRSTLEEVALADLLLVVVDAADEERIAHIEQVHKVLAEIGAAAVPVLMVYNKIDALTDVSPELEMDAEGSPACVWLSAHTGAGLALLTEAIAKRLGVTTQQIHLPPAAAKLRAQLLQAGCVQTESTDADGWMLLTVRGEQAQLARWCAEAGYPLPTST